MNLWFKKILIFILAGVTYLAGQYYRGVWFQDFFVNTCESYISGGKVFCNSPYSWEWGFPLIDLGQMLVIVAIILLFANASTFRKWLKFMFFYVPIFIVVDLSIYPMKVGLGFMGSTTLTYSHGLYNFGKLLILVTFVLVVKDRIAEYRAKSKQPENLAF